MFPENTLVRTGFEDSSFTPIQMLQQGSKVVTHKGQLRPIARISTLDNFQGNILLITAQGFSYSIRCFPRISLMVYRHLRSYAEPEKVDSLRVWEVSWRKASLLDKHDFIRLSLPLSTRILDGTVKSTPAEVDPRAAYTSIKDIISVPHTTGTMYGITVEEDNSFIANGFTVRI